MHRRVLLLFIVAALTIVSNAWAEPAGGDWLAMAEPQPTNEAAPVPNGTPNAARGLFGPCETDWWMETYELPLPGEWRFYWKQGVHFEAPQGFLTLKFGGRIQADYGWLNGAGSITDDRALDLESQGEFRRVRIYISGTAIQKLIDFKMQFGYAGGGTTLQDFFIRLNELPFVGHLKIGHFKEPFSLEDQTSSKHVTFLERALPNALTPGHNWGLMLHNTAFEERMTWAVGVFHGYHNNAIARYGSSSQGEATSMTGRVTFLPYYADEGRQLVHVGASWSLRSPENAVRFSARPEAHMTPYLSRTSSMHTNRVHLVGAEAAWVHGPFSAQAEWIAAAVDGQRESNDTWFHGFYVQGSYFLTGEHRPYDTKNGVFKGIKPNANFLSGCGLGAWEVATRFSALDLRDGGSSGHRMHNVTAGVNWYLNPNVRVSWNYIRSWLNGPGTSDAFDLFLMRFQIAF